MAAPRASEDVELEMPDYDVNNHQPAYYPNNNNLGTPHSSRPPSVRPSVNPSLNVSRADSEFERGSIRTEDMSDIGVDSETIGMRYACPNIGCGTPDKPMYTNPKYATNDVPGKKRYPTLDRPPSRAASQSTVHSTNQSTADLVGKKGANPAPPPTGCMAKFKAFWKDPRYDKLRAIILIVLLIIILLLIIVLPIVFRNTGDEEEPVSVPEYEVVHAPLAVCAGRLLEGYKKDGVAEFRGIPFAEPPVGEKRWRPAVPVSSDNCNALHYTQAKYFGHQCYQSPTVRKDSNESEDCLYLNVWTPTNSSADPKLPVMVWFHDGELRTGSSSRIARYPLKPVIQEGNFILVSMNYRLQALGFLALQQLQDSNMGISDQIAALQWVQQNIEGFGGDKTKVTLFGLGSGATSILGLMNSNLATGLFHRVWLMSPGVVQDKPLVAAKISNDVFLRTLGCQLGDAATVKSCLYGKTAAQILAGVPWYDKDVQWAQPQKFDVPTLANVSSPYIVTDNLVGGQGTFEALKAGTLVNKVPVIIGNGDADSDLRPPSLYFGDGTVTQYITDQQLQDNIKTRLEAFDPDIMSKIQNDYPNLETEKGFTHLVSDIRALCPSNLIADYLQKMSSQVYRYIYEMPPAMRLNAFEHDFWATQSFQGIDMLAFFGALDGDEFSPFFNNAQPFAQGLRQAIFKFIRGETIAEWSAMPKYMLLTASATKALPADDGSYPRNCSHWTSLIPTYSWSN